PSQHQNDRLRLWYRVRCEAGIEDVRLHDLRHTVASQAAMNGVPLPVVARMLGHGNVRMTMRYAHVGDREIEAAAESVGQAIDAIMSRGRNDRREDGSSGTLPECPC
ncbi:MAG: tyrosine-type recombinase/integrase, partial [Alphaproteobacteria bacterium]|nr:tyrosine-type recombinase/integrase [Alphaproteobacteria bacterium]